MFENRGRVKAHAALPFVAVLIARESIGASEAQKMGNPLLGESHFLAIGPEVIIFVCILHHKPFLYGLPFQNSRKRRVKKRGKFV